MGGSCHSSSLALQPNAEGPKDLDAESAEDGGPDYQEDDMVVFSFTRCGWNGLCRTSLHRKALALPSWLLPRR